jgi:hypothetical protein
MKFDTYTSRAGKTHPAFESPYATHNDAATALRELGARDPEVLSDFAVSLLANFDRWGDRMFDTQAYWLHKLATPRQQRDTSRPLEAFTGITEMLERATTGKKALKRPKVVLRTEAGRFIRVATPGPESKFAGKLTVASPEFGCGWYGTIDTATGAFRPARDCDDDVLAALRGLDEDPVGVATSYGKLVGQCCFCSRDLTDEKSTKVGYGPVCAARYGLPWGVKEDTAGSATIDDDHEEAAGAGLDLEAEEAAAEEAVAACVNDPMTVAKDSAWLDDLD